MIDRITASEVLSGCRQILGLSVGTQPNVDKQLLAGLLRRSAGIHCPCSQTTLRTFLLENLTSLSTDDTSLPEKIDTAIEALIIGGDLLELNDVVIGDENIPSTWVFAAPPSFVVRPSGNVFLFGIVPDQDTFLPSYFATRIGYNGYTRTIKPQPGQDIAKELREQGLQEFSEATWLKSPKPETAKGLLERLKGQLADQPPSGNVNGLSILDSTRPVLYYRGRWVSPARENGVFVAKRPQEFGAPIWCFAHLEKGVPIRILDFPLKQSRWRGCDVAWYLQMAIDQSRSNPQRYQRTASRGDVRFDFYSPLPQWSERRLMLFGQSVPPRNSLISYLLPPSEAEAEEQHLQQMLWLSPAQDLG